MICPLFRALAKTVSKTSEDSYKGIDIETGVRAMDRGEIYLAVRVSKIRIINEYIRL